MWKVPGPTGIKEKNMCKGGTKLKKKKENDIAGTKFKKKEKEKE